MGVIASANATFALALSRFVPTLLALAIGAGLYFASMPRFIAQMRDRPRPRWITLFIDLPLFEHFGASVFAFLVSPICFVLALLRFALADGSLFEFWRTALCVAYALGAAISAWSIWIERRFVRVRQITVKVVDLPPEFDGYRITQLSDLHVGSFDPKRRALEWVALSNSLNPDLTVVTGDLVTSGTGFYRDVAETLAELRAKDGVFVSMGNHDQAHNDELSHLIGEHGPVVLRNASHALQRGAATLTVAGLDGRITSDSEVTRAVNACRSTGPFVLLSHYPWTFDAAAAAGADLVLAGHTHGGQLGIPFLSKHYNLARLTHQPSRGLFHLGKAAMYVNAGLGTTGPPMRLAVPPEIAVITLRRG